MDVDYRRLEITPVLLLFLLLLLVFHSFVAGAGKVGDGLVHLSGLSSITSADVPTYYILLQFAILGLICIAWRFVQLYILCKVVSGHIRGEKFRQFLKITLTSEAVFANWDFVCIGFDASTINHQ